MKNKQIATLGHPLFIFSVAVLIVNDWYLKQAYHNALTGKLSDFAGLLAFPFFIATLFPRFTNTIHAGTALLFIWWKSALSEPFLEVLRAAGLPAYRVIDASDNIALISIVVSFILLKEKRSFSLRPVALRVVLVIAPLAFMATTLPQAHLRKFTRVNKEYKFDIPKRELVSRLNALQLREIAIMGKMSGGQVNFNSASNTFHFNGSTDTLAMILDHTKINDTDTIVYKTSFVEIMISGDAGSSALKLLSVYDGVTKGKEEKAFGQYAIKAFEKHVIKKMRRFPEPYKQDKSKN